MLCLCEELDVVRKVCDEVVEALRVAREEFYRFAEVVNLSEIDCVM